MPRRKGKSARKAGSPPPPPEGSPGADDSSLSSAADAVGPSEVVLDADGQAGELLDQLSEKRASRRVDAIVRLRSLMQRHVLAEFCQAQQATLSSLALASLRKGGPAEAVPACRVVALAVLTLAEEGCPLYHDAADTLLRTLRDPKKKERVRAAAAEALAVSCFVADTGDLESRADEFMGVFFGLFDLTGVGGGAPGGAAAAADDDASNSDGAADGDSSDEEPGSGEESDDAAAAAEVSLVEAAARAWALLATSVTARRRAQLLLSAGPALRLMLEHPELGVRAAAGTALALLHRDFCALAPPDAKAEELDLDEMVAKLAAMSREGSRRRAKRERREQRAIFRRVAASVEDGEEPCEEMVLQHDRFEFPGWVAAVRLAALRRVLGSGLNQHFLHNELLSAVFNVRAHVSARPELAKADLKVRKEDQIWEAQQRARDRAEHDKKARKKKQQHVLAGDDDY